MRRETVDGLDGNGLLKRYALSMEDKMATGAELWMRRQGNHLTTATRVLILTPGDFLFPLRFPCPNKPTIAYSIWLNTPWVTWLCKWLWEALLCAKLRFANVGFSRNVSQLAYQIFLINSLYLSLNFVKTWSSRKKPFLRVVLMYSNL